MGLVAGIKLTGVLGTPNAWEVGVCFFALSAYRTPAQLLQFGEVNINIYRFIFS